MSNRHYDLNSHYLAGPVIQMGIQTLDVKDHDVQMRGNTKRRWIDGYVRLLFLYVKSISDKYFKCHSGTVVKTMTLGNCFSIKQGKYLKYPPV